MDDINQDATVTVRISHSVLKEIGKIVEDNPDVYDSVSHFFRIVAIKELRKGTHREYVGDLPTLGGDHEL